MQFLFEAQGSVTVFAALLDSSWHIFVRRVLLEYSKDRLRMPFWGLVKIAYGVTSTSFDRFVHNIRKLDDSPVPDRKFGANTMDGKQNINFISVVQWIYDVAYKNHALRSNKLPPLNSSSFLNCILHIMFVPNLLVKISSFLGFSGFLQLNLPQKRFNFNHSSSLLRDSQIAI